MVDERLKEMTVTGINIDPFTNIPFIILKDKEKKSAIPIWIGLIEASSIATKLENIKLARPMTHDLMKNVFDLLNITVTKVIITDLKDNTYYAEIYINHNGKDFTIDSRPSDAIAVSLRTGSPIFVTEEVIQKSRKVDLAKNGTDKKTRDKWKEILENLSPDDFGKYKM